MTLKIGIIGTNFISDDFCDAAAQVDGIELYAVYSRSADTGNHLPKDIIFPLYSLTMNSFLIHRSTQYTWLLLILHTALNL